MEETAPVEAHAIRKVYGTGDSTTVALDTVSVGFEAGTMTALMGPSGSGKSTLLYCLAGLEQPDAGASVILGQHIAAMSRTRLAEFRRDNVGFVFQAYNLIPALTVYENVALPARLAKRPVPEQRIREVLDQVGLASKIDAMPTKLSGGQQQRVAIARVIAAQPRVVFADEPTGALDSASGDAVLQLLEQVPATSGQCVVMATHDPAVAARCHRVVFLRDGAIVKEVGRSSADEIAEVLAHLRDERPAA